MSSQTFSFTVANTADATRSFILGSGLVAEQGQIVDGAFDAIEDAPAGASLTASGSPETIESFINFMKNNPMLVSRMKFKSTSNDQTEVTINYKRESPFRSLGDRNINLASFNNENTQRDNIVTCTEPLQFDDQTKLEVPVVASSTLVVTLTVSQVANGAEYAKKIFSAN